MPVPNYTDKVPHEETKCAPPEAPPLCSLGVQKAANHTAKLQFEGWKKVISTCCNILSRSPLGENNSTTVQHFALKTQAVLTDHASDQKLLFKILGSWMVDCDRELRGQKVIAAMSEEERIQALSTHLDIACCTVGNWERLDPDQQSAITHDAWLALALTTGEESFQVLSKE
jgi:hypothetical protein